MQTHSLESAQWRVTVDPANGMGWLNGKALQADTWLDVLPDCTQPSVNLDQCNFLLLPYSNRIRDGKFHFEGKDYQLKNAARHAIHGVVRKLPWVVNTVDAQHITATLNTTDHNEVNWPWPFLAQTELRVSENQLISTLRIQNLGDSAMPVGGGWHPYFVRHIQKAAPHLSLPVTGVYPDTDGDCLPTGGPEALPEALSFVSNVALPENQRIDHCFAGLSGPMSITWPDAALTLTLSYSKQMTHAILYNPAEAYFALEPVSHANDAVNLAQQGIDTGLQTLSPGDSWQDSLTISINQTP